MCGVKAGNTKCQRKKRSDPVGSTTLDWGWAHYNYSLPKQQMPLLPEGQGTIHEKGAVWQNPAHALHRLFLLQWWELNIGAGVDTSWPIKSFLQSSR